MLWSCRGLSIALGLQRCMGSRAAGSARPHPAGPCPAALGQCRWPETSKCNLRTVNVGERMHTRTHMVVRSLSQAAALTGVLQEPRLFCSTCNVHGHGLQCVGKYAPPRLLVFRQPHSLKACVVCTVLSGQALCSYQRPRVPASPRLPARLACMAGMTFSSSGLAASCESLPRTSS